MTGLWEKERVTGLWERGEGWRVEEGEWWKGSLCGMGVIHTCMTFCPGSSPRKEKLEVLNVTGVKEDPYVVVKV